MHPQSTFRNCLISYINFMQETINQHKKVPILSQIALDDKIDIIYIVFTSVRIINTIVILMAELIKKHRRNKAVEAGQDCFRQSIPYVQLETMRKSIGMAYQSPKTFRSSDVANLNIRESFAQKNIKNIQPNNPETFTNKQPSTLRSTLQDLELKLKKAKKFLQNKPSEKDFFGEQLMEVINANPHSDWSDNFWEKLEESTINLESQKKLISVVKSKEKLVWARKIKQYYLSQVAKGVVGINQRALEHLQISLEVLKSCRQSDLPDSKVIPRSKLNLPQQPKYVGKKVLIVDLDETLFHCDFERNSTDDIEVDISGDGSEQKGYVSIRPYALSFLKRATQHFEVIAFTASEKSYADTILDEIDFEHKLIQHRLYREHCVRLNQNVYAKDLSIINRPLSQMVLVDNSPISYLYQRSNGIPILPYAGGEDTELLALEKYLDLVKKEADVRVINRRTFKLELYQQYEDCQQLVHDLYFQDKDYY